MNRTLITDTPAKVGESVTIKGWVNTRRDHGKIVFLDIRDRSGILQVVTTKDTKASQEDVVEVIGKINLRPKSMTNPDMATGTVELVATHLSILNPSAPLPFPIDTDGLDINEEIRLKHRYLDLRRPRLQKNIKLRSAYIKAAREYLFSQNFTEIETPILTKSTPEGSRDFVVPSRLQPGKFFALPQSPQQYKQLLMTAGFERYFQVARCLRDEDPRADRAFEHTQIDLEMSFVSREDVMNLIEQMIIHACQQIDANIASTPFPVVTYQQAMEKYGADKFDLRTETEKQAGTLSFAWVIDFPFFEKTENGSWTFTHNPFSQPINDHLDWLLNQQNIDQIITNQYDLVCNGLEVAGGSIRAHKPEVLRSVFQIMGYQDRQIDQKFGHMLDAFSFGTPPHGGCAHGFERLLMAHLGEEYIREVQAFPQTGRGRTSVMDAPSVLDPAQLLELGISLNQTPSSGSVLDQLKSKLDSLNIPYSLTSHQPVHTSEEAARVRGASLATGAKALVMIADKSPILVVVSAATKVDTKALKQLHHIHDLRLASPEEVEQTIGVKIGAVPPFGSLFNLPTFIDKALTQQTTINFNPGVHDHTISMSLSDYLRAEQPQTGSFSK